MPTYPQSPDGFTLVELLVVMSIMALGAVLLVAAMPSRSMKGLDEAQLMQMLADVRAAAIASGEQTHLDSDELAAASVKFRPAIGGADSPVFYPDGSSNGGTIELASGQTIELRWIDGAMHAAR
ncbi:MAG: prepilin-type N-terminal cleavage/methylation domain-containing protein [Blastomonas sp.]